MSRATYFHLDCPTCGRPLQIRISLLGKLVSCRHCRAAFSAVADEAGDIRGQLVSGQLVTPETDVQPATVFYPAARQRPATLRNGTETMPSTVPAGAGDDGSVELDRVEQLLAEAERFLAAEPAMKTISGDAG